MTGGWQERVGAIAEQIVGSKTPGLAVAVAREERPPDYFVTGADAQGQPLTVDTLFPVASITKLAATLAVLRLVADGSLALDDLLAVHLPEAASVQGATQEGVTLRAILCHTGGLPVDLDPAAAPYTPDLNWSLLGRACLATPLADPPRSRVHYGNVGFGLLRIVIERVTGQRFPLVLQEQVLGPLGIEGYFASEPPRRPAYLDVSYSAQAGTAIEPYNSPFWRGLGLPWAGLITTLGGALALARAFGGLPAGYLPPDLLAEARCDQTGGVRGNLMFMRWPRCAWGLGVELHGDKSPHFTPRTASPRTFGHVGSSGCLAYVDPDAGIAWALHGVRRFDAWWQSWPEIGAAVLPA